MWVRHLQIWCTEKASQCPASCYHRRPQLRLNSLANEQQPLPISALKSLAYSPCRRLLTDVHSSTSRRLWIDVVMSLSVEDQMVSMRLLRHRISALSE